VSNGTSFEHVRNTWLPFIQNYGGDKRPCILVATKIDQTRVIKPEDAIELASMYNMRYIETSSKWHIGISNLWQHVLSDAPPFVEVPGPRFTPRPTWCCFQ